MRIVEYRHTVTARVQLTAAEIYHAIAQALSHYDFKCKSVARPGPNGFLNAFKNTIGADGTSTQFLTTQELDLLSKILEGLGADIGLKQAVRECWHALQDEIRSTERVMRAVNVREPFTEPKADDNRHEPLYLTLEQVQFARNIARRMGERDRVIPDQCIAMGVLSAYLDDEDCDPGTEHHLNARELRALISMLHGNPLQATVQETLKRLLSQKAQP